MLSAIHASLATSFSSRTAPSRHRPIALLLGTIGTLAALGPAVVLAAGPAGATGTISAAPVVVTATREERPSFDLPVSIDVVSAESISEAQPMVNAAESLARVPGLVSPNQYRMSSDQQLSSRGFGARAGFGVRGIRIYADGIPQSMPDGQGQTGSFNLSSAERIEVMRGPFSALYGNSSGGVVQIFTKGAPARPTLGASYYAGSFDTWRSGLQYGGRHGGVDAVVDLSRYQTDGYRAHSAARRDQANLKLSTRFGDDDKLTVVLNHTDLPYAKDPQGLTRAEMSANPAQANANSVLFNTGGYKNQTHAGAIWEHRIDADRKLAALFYAGHRESLQRLSIPVGVQSSNTHPGGTSTIDRDFAGGDVRYSHGVDTGLGRLTVTAGVNVETMTDDRKGYINNNGVQGALKRDEDNIARNVDQYLQAEWQAGTDWVISAGLRRTEIKLEAKDRFIVAGTPNNPDDSGSVTFRNTSPVIGALYHATPTLNLYANAGRGYETPTFIEIAYTTSGTGLNFGLKPAKSMHYEVGAKAFVGANTRVNLAAFRIDTDDEIVVASASGGRTTFKNAGATSRDGVELALSSSVLPNLEVNLSYALLRAEFDDAFASGAGGTVRAGNWIPGAPRVTAYGEVVWKVPAIGMTTALEARHTGEIKVNDTNTDAAAASTIVNWRIGFEQKFGRLTLKEFARVENVGDRRYVGGVNVNDTNSRFFAPAPGRNHLLGASVAMAF
jgi:iron complex outermembrane recepter protein